MSIEQEKRMAGDYVIIHAFHIGDREIVLGENPASKGNDRYMCAFCQNNGLMAGYTEMMVSKDYPELARLFGERVAEQAEKTRIDLNGPKIQGILNEPITADGCEVIGYQHDLRGKIVVIKPEVLRPEYRRATSQLYLCDGGFGAVNANWKMSFFAGMGCHFLAVSMRWVCSLDYPLLVGLKPVKS